MHQTVNSDSKDGGRSARRWDRGLKGVSNPSNDERRPRKRGRPRRIPRDTVKGITDAEIRRFIKSNRKITAPAKRLDAVAQDAKLHERPQAYLKRLAHLLHCDCEQMKESRPRRCRAGRTPGTAPWTPDRRRTSTRRSSCPGCR
ncbi:hypothetical protein HPB47_002380 [Ixodes persulcatus]|uniref:Uncharacterized protein n=1 Tax=Ixodes persulcatus TaxID=34615 RepID=A0AC60PMB2_IXOPE|nr:hypothetical protein HPB47_002380 [Ixodes persulcatus]